jgi:hypothetical protein
MLQKRVASSEKATFYTQSCKIDVKAAENQNNTKDVVGGFSVQNI